MPTLLKGRLETAALCSVYFSTSDRSPFSSRITLGSHNKRTT
ncbi:hypothetical protein [Nostoc commune]|nr:hypothetical protein [Nostoc commune]